jgi:glycine/D-amino acid oxidase-like deaminating enzyme
MAEFPARAKVVIIGLGGIVGASIAHHLIERGWDDIVGIDKSGIPTDIGSTAHASDFCYTTSHDYLSVWTTQYSIDFFEKMGHYARIGGLEVVRAGDHTWMEEVKRKLSSAKAFGTRAHYVSPAEIKKLFPLIEEDQAFVIDGGGPLNPATLENHLWCEADGVGQRIPARPVAAPIHQEVIKQANMPNHAIVVACAENLPAGRKMKLVWGKGIKADNGTPSNKEQAFVYTVREPFTASLSCEREKAGAPCSPLSAIRTSTPGAGTPTVSERTSPSGCTVMKTEASVWP